MTNSDEGMTLVEHLTELRIRLIRSVLWITAGCAICYNFSDVLFDFVRKPIAPYLTATGGGLIFTAPMDKFMAHLKISLLGGLIVSAPFWFHQIWKFVAPGLHDHEKKYGAFFILFGTLLFLLGAAFAYFVVYPTAFEFLMNYGGDLDRPMITINEYLSFFILTMLLFGVSFELPLVLIILALLQIIDEKFLRDKRRFAVVFLAAMSAILTPSTDLLSMVLMLIPLCILYESSIWIIRFMMRNRKVEA